ncbi:hypothetical protein NSK_002925 [Nannochloropsis salina CCMP1776]|uniref:Replication factor Mcm10 C-terminal domain-containing protein n=1 Tax=Nannochloropsis salina CCMP1776 TaxID=1027361 RepID=A0A4D9D9F9_9STRA|nr:hypothetical protein NSK_002925 [Nannochloropsis salina CCMP1776]|eukprot:TFJ86105.1 hypothetical protein NSK_002925 [Nannochloropsis salina CCMP1776]
MDVQQSAKENGVRGIAAILAADELNKNGEVLIPQPSRIFSRGPDSVAYAAFRHEQEAKRQARQVGALQYRQLQQKQSEAKAVRAMNFCKRMGGTIRMIQKPENVMLEPKPRMTAPSSAGNRRQLYADGMGLKEAERLMKSKSKHSAEARGELMEHLHGVFEALGEKETRAEYFKNLSSIEVVAVSCQECNRLFEKHPRLCAKRGHILKRLTIKKRFFICGNQGCSEEVSMLGSAAPHEACSRCGEKLWRAKGKGSKAAAGGEARAKSNGVGVLIPAVSEWNRNADLSSLYTE